jgi:hypothetical protein
MSHDTTPAINRQDLDEARAAVLPALLESVRKYAPSLDAGLANSLASLGATMVARQALEQQAKPPAAQAPTETETATPVQLAAWGEDYRAAPNAIFRSALFPALSGRQKENRRFLEKEDIVCVAGLKIIFTGQQFDQSDLDVYLEILNMARNVPLGMPINFSAHALLKVLGLPTGGSNHARLHEVLIRLRGGTVEIIDHGIRYFGGLIEGGLRDEASLHYSIIINPGLAAFFEHGLWSKIDLEIRRRLRQNPTAKSLHVYYSSHINPAAHRIETLANLAGVRGKNKKATLIKAHEAMKEAGFLADYEATSHTIKPLVNHMPSQDRAIVKKAAKAKAAKASSRRNKPTLAGDLLPRLPNPKSKG